MWRGWALGFPFVWIQCPDNRLHYPSIFRITADFTISPNHVLSMCPMKQCFCWLAMQVNCFIWKYKELRATIFWGRGDHTFSFGIHTILVFTNTFDLNSCGFSLLVATFVTFSRSFCGLFKKYVLLFWTKLFFITTVFLLFHTTVLFSYSYKMFCLFMSYSFIYTTHCLDHISFQANCPNLWNVKIVPNKILQYEHYIFIFNTTNFYHMQMCWSFPFPCSKINTKCTNKKYNQTSRIGSHVFIL